MSIWKNSKMFSITTDGSVTQDNYPCQVLIDDKRIVVSYFEEGESVSYTGTNKKNDHFYLECNELDGKASLHRFPQSDVLIGGWVEEGDEGFWKIKLK